MGVKESNTVVLYKKFDERKNELEGGDLTLKKLANFLEKYSFADFMKLNDRSTEKIF